MKKNVVSIIQLKYAAWNLQSNGMSWCVLFLLVKDCVLWDNGLKGPHSKQLKTVVYNTSACLYIFSSWKVYACECVYVDYT